MNEYDSNRIFDSIKKIGYEKTEKYEDANCYLLNTCHIRDKAKEKVYSEIGRVKKIFRFKKKPLVIIAGCVAQAENQEMLKREPFIDLVIGPQAYHKINDTILNYVEKQKKIEETEFDAVSKFEYFSKIKNKVGKVSSFLTIQEGCDKFCHFCVVPYTRGPECSRPPSQILDEAKYLADNGVREITLLGQNVNAYKSNGFRLSDLISSIEKLNEIKRVRYTTSHPKDMTNDLIEVYKSSNKLMPLLHLPVQSGSNKILKSMNRKHSVEYYKRLIEKLKKINPLIRFSSDFIIGYPGETDKDFEMTLRLFEDIEFIHSYSFIYSPRPGTPASKMKMISAKIAKERLIYFQKYAEDIKMKYRKNLFNTKAKVLFENKSKEKDKYFGRDEFLNSIIVKSKNNLTGKIKDINIINGNQNTLYGEIEKNRFNDNAAA